MAERAKCGVGLVDCFASGLFQQIRAQRTALSWPQTAPLQNWGSQKMAEQVTGGFCWDRGIVGTLKTGSVRKIQHQIPLWYTSR